MKNNYDFNKMKKVSHPFMNSQNVLFDNVTDIPSGEFNQKAEALSTSERVLAIRYRKKHRRHQKSAATTASTRLS